MIPKYLYQYTSLEAVKSIISNKNIKFTSLASTKINDPLEGYFKYEENDELYKFLDNFIFVSCWSADENESIPMWMIYGKNNGVRIKIKSNMFSRKHELIELSDQFLPVEILSYKISIGPTKLSSPTTIDKVIGPYPVLYRENIDNLHKNANNQTLENTENHNKVNFNNFIFNELGNEKLKYWSYENEYRYKITPFVQISGAKQLFEKIKNVMVNGPINVYVPIINSIEEIIFGPNCSDADFDKYAMELKTLGFNGSIKKSKLKINF